jgi:hypothetical protein
LLVKRPLLKVYEPQPVPNPVIPDLLITSQLALGLWELARNPEVQTKLRTELDANVSAKGNADFTAAELENMPYLNAVIKVICLGDNTKARTEWNT